MSRTRILGVGLLVMVAIFVVRLFYIQVIKHDFYETEAYKSQVTKFTIQPKRGQVYAMDGHDTTPLVLNESVYTVFADPQEVKDPDKIARTMRRIAGGNVLSGFEENLTSSKLRYVVMARQVSRAQAELIKRENLSGVGLQEAHRRVYPEGQLGAQMLGFVDSEGKGQYGLEGFLDKRLTGTPGQLQAVTDVRRIPLTIGSGDVRQAAHDGDDLVLSIDRNIQAQAEQVLKAGLDKAHATKGSMLVMDPQTGAVMAMANFPTYDPAKYNEVTDYSVFQNSIVSSPYEAGSVLKTLTMGAGIDSGAVSANSTYNNTGKVQVDDTTISNVEEDPIFPNTTMTDVLQYSLNTGRRDR